MAEKLKNLFFTRDSIELFANSILDVYSEFAKEQFIDFIYENEWNTLELKSKMRHVSICLFKCLPEDYEKSIKILIKIAPHIKGFEGMVLPDFVELYGQDFWDISLLALKEFTKYSSSEFAIRPFIIKNPQKVMKYMFELAEDKNDNVRRFASEGCRPRLPWAMALPKFKKDPAPIIPILDRLKNDPSEFVRRSVANNLNDISKDNPEMVLELCTNWIGKSERTDRIIKHACRTMLKAGDKGALILFGYKEPNHIKVSEFEISAAGLKIGQDLKFSFILEVQSKNKSKLRIEYAIDYLKANGSHNRKVFKIAENTYRPAKHHFIKKHSFAEMTTRKHYKGLHKISIIVNGEMLTTKSFQVN